MKQIVILIVNGIRGARAYNIGWSKKQDTLRTCVLLSCLAFAIFV